MQALVVRNKLRFGTFLAVGFYLVVFSQVTLHHQRFFSPDSMNYVDVARNLNAGRGLVQPTLGYNQYTINPDDPIPVPLTAQPPLYPILIASVARLGLGEADVALLLPVLGFAVVLVLSHRLGAHLAGESGGWLALSLALLNQPLREVAGSAWSESMAIAFVLACCLLLGRTRLRARPFWAGLVAGLAVATRYALIPVVLLGPVQFLFEKDSPRSRLARCVFFGLGAAIPIGGVVWHNWQVLGRVMPPVPPASDGCGDAFEAIWRGLLRLHLGIFSADTERFLLVVPLVLVSVILARRGRLEEAAREIGWRRGRVIGCWILAYCGFLWWRRCTQHFDNIDLRLLAPATTGVLLLWTAWLVTLWRWSVRWFQVAALAVALFLTGQATTIILRGDVPASRIDPLQDERLIWLKQNLHSDDLVIGNSMVRVPFYLRHPVAVTFQSAPYSAHATADLVRGIAAWRARDDSRVLLALEKVPATEDLQMQQLGPFFTDLIQGRLEAYPDLRVLADTPSFVAFEVATPSAALDRIP